MHGDCAWGLIVTEVFRPYPDQTDWFQRPCVYASDA